MRGVGGEILSPLLPPMLKRRVSPGDLVAGRARPLAEVARNPETILYHDDSNVGIEHQVTEMVKNQMQHNLALAILTSQMRLLEAAISERA